MQLSKSSYDHYWAKGWCVVEHVFGAAEIDRIVALAMEISQREMDADSNYIADRSSDGAEVLPRKIGGPFDKHESFRTFALDQRLARLGVDCALFEPRNLQATADLVLKNRVDVVAGL